MWGLAAHAACYIYNRTPHSALDFITPFEKLYKKLPDVTNLQIFGAWAYILNETLPKGQKFTSRSNTFYVVGFSKTGYKVFDPTMQKTTNVCNVKIDETVLYKNDFPNSNPNNDTFIVPEDQQIPINQSDPIPSTSRESHPINNPQTP